MSDILSRLEMAVAENNGAAIINIVKGELMDAKGKTVIELPCEVGDTVYRIFDGEIETLLVENAMYDSLFDRWKVFAIPYICIYWADSIGKTVFLTEQAAKDALERGKNERN